MIRDSFIYVCAKNITSKSSLFADITILYLLSRDQELTNNLIFSSQIQNEIRNVFEKQVVF